MASEYDINIIVQLVNKFSHEAKALSKDAHDLGKKINEIGTTSDTTGTKLLGLLGPIAGFGLGVGTAALGIGVWAAKGAMVTDANLGKIEVAMTGTAEHTEKVTQKLKRGLEDFSMSKVPININDLIAGAEIVQRVLGDNADLYKRTVEGAMAGYVTFTSPAKSIGLITQLQKSYNDTTEETYEWMANALPLAIHRSRAEFASWSLGAGRAAPLFHKLGVSLEEFLGIFSVSTEVMGGHSSNVAFQMSSLITAFQKYEDVLQIIPQLEKEYPGKGLAKFFSILREAMKADDASKMHILRAFGSRGEAALSFLTELEQIEDIQAFTDYVSDKDFISEYNTKALEKLTTGMQEAGYEWGRLSNAGDTFKRTLGEIVGVESLPFIENTKLGLEVMINKLRDFQDMTKKAGEEGKKKPSVLKELILKPLLSAQDFALQYAWWPQKKLVEKGKDFLSGAINPKIGEDLSYLYKNITLLYHAYFGDTKKAQASLTEFRLDREKETQFRPTGFIEELTRYDTNLQNISDAIINGVKEGVTNALVGLKEAPDVIAEKVLSSLGVKSVFDETNRMTSGMAGTPSEIVIRVESEQGLRTRATSVNIDPNVSLELENSVFGGWTTNF